MCHITLMMKATNPSIMSGRCGKEHSRCESRNGTSKERTESGSVRRRYIRVGGWATLYGMNSHTSTKDEISNQTDNFPSITYSGICTALKSNSWIRSKVLFWLHTYIQRYSRHISFELTEVHWVFSFSRDVHNCWSTLYLGPTLYATIHTNLLYRTVFSFQCGTVGVRGLSHTQVGPD